MFTEVWSIVAAMVDTNVWMSVAYKGVTILIILIVMILAKKMGYAIVHRLITKKENSRIHIESRRLVTLQKLLNNILNYTVMFIGILMILAQLGIDLLPIIAGAGVVGLAVAFGAQNLVRDVITGLFIIFEDQFAIGDTVRVAGYEGTVLEIGLRITKIRGWSGEIHIIPNGSITELTNYSMHNSIVIVEMRVAYTTDIPQVTRLFNEHLATLFTTKSIPELIAPPAVLGVQSLGQSEVVLGIRAECQPMMHYKVKRILQQELLDLCKKESIEIPYPHVVHIQKPNDDEHAR